MLGRAVLHAQLARGFGKTGSEPQHKRRQDRKVQKKRDGDGDVERALGPGVGDDRPCVRDKCIACGRGPGGRGRAGEKGEVGRWRLLRS